MCSFLFSTKQAKEVESINKLLKFRGPDHTQITTINNHLFLHNLLSITGDFKPQPYIDKEDSNIVLLYNGEIYNFQKFGNYTTDGECLIPLYKKHGTDFIKHLDGEFAVCLIDYRSNIILISSDVFKTKPIYYGVHNDEFACSTYKTPLEELNFDVKLVEPNTTYVFDLVSKKLLYTNQVYEFDLNQHKTTYEDWVQAFQFAIKKRIINTNKKIFIGLSSGYDSGAIFNELLKNNVTFHSYTLTGTENDEIINQRLSLKTNFCVPKVIPKNSENYMFSHLMIRNRTEPFSYTIKSDFGDYTETDKLLIDDEGANNFATICRLAKRDGCKICLSGTGADEIISDYGFAGTRFFSHSNFGGRFPEDLKEIFPWGSFYKSTMESYIAKEEYVGGSYGIEMRYPFLDKKVVQEFLWLDYKLKNEAYKAPLDYYFKQNNFPYEQNQKRGF